MDNEESIIEENDLDIYGLVGLLKSRQERILSNQEPELTNFQDDPTISFLVCMKKVLNRFFV